MTHTSDINLKKITTVPAFEVDGKLASNANDALFLSQYDALCEWVSDNGNKVDKNAMALLIINNKEVLLDFLQAAIKQDKEGIVK